MKEFNDEFIFRYLNKARVPYLKTEVKDRLLNHPGTPSMKAISDTLESLNVKTMAVGLDMADLNQVEFPAIAHLKKGYGEFVLLEKKKNDEVSYFQRGKLQTENLEAFEKNWSGKTLLLQKPDRLTIDDPKTYYWKKYGMTALSVILCLVILALIILIVGTGPLNQGLYLTSLLLLNLAGLGLSGYLYRIHLSKSTGEDRFCKKTKTVDCTAVLFSKWSKLFGLFNWAQLGILYFFGQSLSLLLGLMGYDHMPSTTFLLACLTGLAACFSLYSIVLQALVIKKWCTLCLACQGIILATTALNLYQGSLSHVESDSIGFLSVGLSHLLGFFAIKMYTEQADVKASLKQKTIQLARFKGDKDIFQQLLTKQSKALDYRHLKGAISLGHVAAPNEILMVASLHCGPCIRMFRELIGLIEDHPDKLKLKIIFTMALTDTPQNAPVNARLINLAITDKGIRVVEALNAWYDSIGTKDGEQAWLKQYTPNGLMTSDDLKEPFREYQEWLAKARIFKTPTLFFNQSELPQIYASRESLGYLLD